MGTGDGMARDDDGWDDGPAERRPLSPRAGRRQAKRDWKQRERRVKREFRAHPWGPDAPYRSVFTNARGRASLFVARAGKPQAVIAVLTWLLAVGALVETVTGSGRRGGPLLWALTATMVAVIFTVLSLSARRRWFLRRAGDLWTLFTVGELLGMTPLLLVLVPTAGDSTSVGSALGVFAFGLALGTIVGALATYSAATRFNRRYVFKA